MRAFRKCDRYSEQRKIRRRLLGLPVVTQVMVEERESFIDTRPDTIRSRRSQYKRVGPRVRAEMLERADLTCYHCERPLDKESLTIDHLVALADGGSNSFDNLVPACRNCNCTRPNTAAMRYNEALLWERSCRMLQWGEAMP